MSKPSTPPKFIGPKIEFQKPPTGETSIGPRAEFLSESVASSHGISKDINDLLNQHMSVQGNVESLEGRIHLATDIGELVNKMLDSVEKKRSLKKPISGNQEATSGLETAKAPPIEKLKLGGQPPKVQGSVEDMYRESVAPYILDTTKRLANTNPQSSDLARDLRKALGLAEENPIQLGNRTLNELVTAKREIYRSNYPHRTKPEFIPKDNPLRPL